MAVEKCDLKVCLTKDKFSSVPQEKHKDCFAVFATWNETSNHPCSFQRKLWMDAIQNKMESNNVCIKCKKRDLPSGTNHVKRK